MFKQKVKNKEKVNLCFAHSIRYPYQWTDLPDFFFFPSSRFDTLEYGIYQQEQNRTRYKMNAAANQMLNHAKI